MVASSEKYSKNKVMTKFYVYNIQLLPLSDDHREVGISGYKKMFSKMREKNKEHLQSHTVEQYHYHLHGDQYLGFDKADFGAGVVTGNFKRYTKTNEVKSLNKGTTVFRNRTSQTTFSRDHDVPFAFDAKNHYLAIEGGSVLTPERVCSALLQFFGDIARQEFPHHELHINVLSSSARINEILETATSYKNVKLSLTFQNGHASQSLLKELKDTKTQRLDVAASGGRDGVMTRLPSFMIDMVKAAAIVGSLKMGYYINGSSARQTYDSDEMPLHFVVRRSEKDSDESYFARVLEKTREETQLLEASVEDADADDSPSDAQDIKSSADDGS
ncbi:DUF4747 family protein [Paenacidovorax monticola]|uniref:DUF4747 family protein n=1 Tax=Paenacidovorax monticola TaxID=1926868 RepID=A0A7H0HG00_9BURK|nr:DUF4747 family protein [Paenacidovorax monticola]QNP59466.1 DUF4747 family protein [Paenacidovorax monticola]